MKPKPFDALNHFTLPVGTSVSPMSAFWISPRPSFRREAIGRSLLRSFRGKNTGGGENGLSQYDGKSARPAAFPGASFIPIAREISVFSQTDCTLRSRRPPPGGCCDSELIGRSAIQASIDWNDGLHRQIWATAVSDGAISSALSGNNGC